MEEDPRRPSSFVEGLFFTATTGGESGALGTYFALARGETVVAKALCMYQNGVMDSQGPTLELLEVAAEWQGRGLGSALLRAVEGFFCQRWARLCVAGGGRLFLSASVPTGGVASQWLLTRGFVCEMASICQDFLNKDLLASDRPKPEFNLNELVTAHRVQKRRIRAKT
eukprot:1176469-Rhodomonas_salina.1